MALNPRQERFCQLYAEKGNASAAYREAYDGALGAGVSGFRLLTKAKIRERISELTTETAERAAVSREELIAFWLEVLGTPVGEIDASHPLAQEYQHNESGVKVKMPSKERAAQELARLIGAYEPEELKVSGLDVLEGIFKKATGVREE